MEKSSKKYTLELIQTAAQTNPDNFEIIINTVLKNKKKKQR